MPIAYWSLYEDNLLNVSQAFLTGMSVFGTQVVTFANNQLWLFNLDGSFLKTVRVPCNVSNYVAIDSYSLIFAGSEESGETIIGSYSLNTLTKNWLQTVPLTNVKVVFNSALNKIFVVGSDQDNNLVVAQGDPSVGVVAGNRYSLSGSQLVISSASSGSSYFGVFVTCAAGSQMFVASFNASTYISAIISSARSNAIGVVLSSTSSGHCYECGESIIASSVSGRASINFVYESNTGEFLGTGWGVASVANSQFTNFVIIPALPWLLMIGVGVTAGFNPNPAAYNSVMLAAFVNGKLKNTLRIRLAAGDVLSRCHGDLEGSGLLVSCTMINAQNRQENLVFFVDYSLSSYTLSLSTLEAMYQAFSNDIAFSSSGGIYMSYQTLTQTPYTFIALPSSQPTSLPSAVPSPRPSSSPTTLPTAKPTSRPSSRPTKLSDTRRPTTKFSPTFSPTVIKTVAPSKSPTYKPSIIVTMTPTRFPTFFPVQPPTSQPSKQPIERPSSRPSFQPNAKPTKRPHAKPTGQPSDQPLALPSGQPTNAPNATPKEAISIYLTRGFMIGISFVGVFILCLSASVGIYCYLKNKENKEKIARHPYLQDHGNLLQVIHMLRQRSYLQNVVDEKSEISWFDLDPVEEEEDKKSDCSEVVFSDDEEKNIVHLSEISAATAPRFFPRVSASAREPAHNNKKPL